MDVQSLTVWVTDNLDNLRLPPAADLAVETITQVETASHKLPSPTLITNAVSPEVLFVEWRERVYGVSDEAVGGVRVHTQQEGDEQMMGVPERLERLLSDPVVSGRIDEQHAEQHDVSSDTTGLSVMDFKRDFRSNLCYFDVVEATPISGRSQSKLDIYLLDVMSCGVTDGEDEHGVSNLSVEPH